MLKRAVLATALANGEAMVAVNVHLRGAIIPYLAVADIAVA